MLCFRHLQLSTARAGDTDHVNAIINYFNPPEVIPITYYSDKTFHFNNIENNISNNIQDSPVFPVIFQCGFILILLFIFIINNLTRIIKKGGVLLSSN